MNVLKLIFILVGICLFSSWEMRGFRQMVGNLLAIPIWLCTLVLIGLVGRYEVRKFDGDKSTAVFGYWLVACLLFVISGGVGFLV